MRILKRIGSDKEVKVRAYLLGARMLRCREIVLSAGVLVLVLVAAKALNHIWAEADAMENSLSSVETATLCINWFAVGMMQIYLNYVEKHRAPGGSDKLMVLGTSLLVFLGLSSAVYTAALTLLAARKPWPSPVVPSSREKCGYPRNILRGHPGVLAIASQAFFAWQTMAISRRLGRIKDGMCRVQEQEEALEQDVTPEVLGAAAGQNNSLASRPATPVVAS
mmetsp:Transcript_69315/g.166189  ORF Transcript_69315/g.166189 Transcript_69315/m.166189 type:complete len:222 (+) Transcript_69315:115-780(+)